MDELEPEPDPELELALLVVLAALLVEFDVALLPQAASIVAIPAAPAAPTTERSNVRRLSGVRISASAVSKPRV